MSFSCEMASRIVLRRWLHAGDGPDDAEISSPKRTVLNSRRGYKPASKSFPFAFTKHPVRKHGNGY